MNKTRKVDNRIDLLDSILKLLAFFIILRSTFGLVLLLPGYGAQVYFAIYIIWFLLAVTRRQKFLFAIIKRSAWLLIFLFVNIAFDMFFANTLTTIVKNYINLFILYSIYLYYQSDNILFKRVTLFALFCDSLAIMINTIVEMEINPMVSRQLATATGVDDFAGNANLVASFQFIYAGVCLLPYLIVTLKEYTKPIKFSVFLFLIVFITVLAKASFFISLIVPIICLVFSLLPKNIFVKLNILFIGTLVLFLFKDLIVDLLNIISSLNFVNDILAEKIVDLASFLDIGTSGAKQSAGRIELYLQSFEIFTNNIFLGVHSTGEINYFIGRHSGWLDALAEFGIFRLFPLLCFLFLSYKQISVSVSKQFNKAVSLSFIAFALIGFINPNVFTQMWLVLYIVIPFLSTINIIKDEKV